MTDDRCLILLEEKLEDGRTKVEEGKADSARDENLPWFVSRLNTVVFVLMSRKMLDDR
jgi:hypothetical protein